MISVTDISALRAQLPAAPLTSSASLAWQLGAQADDIGTAFVLAYQLAVRYLDRNLKAAELAAFCVSETGLRFLSQMSCQLEQGYLSGSKSHVMLMQPIELDWLYVLARQQGELVLVKVSAQADGIHPQAPLAQPFVPQVRHCPVRFEQVPVEADFCLADAHNTVNKPFRYWEDVHVTLALAGWMHNRVADSPMLVSASQALIEHFDRHPQHYDLAGLDTLEQCLEQLVAAAKNLQSATDQQQWQRDQALMLLSAKARTALRAKFSAR